MPRKPMLTLDQRIERAEAEVNRIKARYDNALAELNHLLELRDEGKRQELLSALARSRRSYAEIMEFIMSAPDQNDVAE